MPEPEQGFEPETRRQDHTAQTPEADAADDLELPLPPLAPNPSSQQPSKSPFANHLPPASFPLPPALERNPHGLPVRFNTSANQYLDQGESASSDPTLDPTNPLFRGYAWRVMQEVRSEVAARQNKAAQGKGLSPNFKKYYMLEDKELHLFSKNFVKLEECCLGREEYTENDRYLTWPKLRQDRKMLGVWAALNYLGSRPVGFLRYSNLWFIIARAIFNAAFTCYNFTTRPSQSARTRYTGVTLAVYFMELLVVGVMLLWICKEALLLAFYSSQAHGHQNAKSRLRVVAKSVTVMKLMLYLGEFSVMHGLKHCMGVVRFYEFCWRTVHEFSTGSSFLVQLMQQTLDDLSAIPVFKRLGSRVQRWLPKSFSSMGRKMEHHTHAWGSDMLHSFPPQFSLDRTQSEGLPPNKARRAVGWLLRAPIVAGSLLALMLTPFAFIAWFTLPAWGIIAFFVKIYQLSFIWKIYIGQWALVNWARFFAFINQLSVLETSERSRLDGKLQFVFWGADDVNDKNESVATDWFVNCIVLDTWMRPGGTLVGGLSKLLWLSPEDINSAFIKEDEDGDGVRQILGGGAVLRQVQGRREDVRARRQDEHQCCMAGMQQAGSWGQCPSCCRTVGQKLQAGRLGQGRCGCWVGGQCC